MLVSPGKEGPMSRWARAALVAGVLLALRLRRHRRRARPGAAEQLIAMSGGVYHDAELARYLRSVGMRLAAAAGQPAARWSFTVLDTPETNAFALAGAADLRDAGNAGAGRRRGGARRGAGARDRPFPGRRRHDAGKRPGAAGGGGGGGPDGAAASDPAPATIPARRRISWPRSWPAGRWRRGCGGGDAGLAAGRPTIRRWPTG